MTHAPQAARSALATPELVLSGLVGAGNVAILSGAGLSTESGIPDYRGAERPGPAGRADDLPGRSRPRAAARQRYWARSHLGWRHIARARPNAGHHAVAELERRGLLAGIITQNVDGLHQAAGRAAGDRAARQPGPGAAASAAASGPRGGELDAAAARGELRLGGARRPRSPRTATRVLADEELAAASASSTARAAAACSSPTWCSSARTCRGRGSRSATALVERAGALVVLGSSLTVMSGLPVRAPGAPGLAMPVVIVNQGATRGDALAVATIDAPLGLTLTDLVRRAA